jgi:Zn-dependent protease with chaperone function
VVAATEPFAFTHGLLVPRVVVSTALVRLLTEAELSAVLAHEAAHVRSRDPFKVLVARTLVAREFYLPALRYLSRRFAAGRELAADRHAVTHAGVSAIAGALLRTAAPPSWAAATPAAAMASATTLHARISQLETGAEPAPAPPPRLQLLGTITTGALVGAAGLDAALLVGQLCMRGM